MADPTKPYPGGYTLPIVWTEDRLEWWVKSQALGIQCYALGEAVYCPRREDQWVVVIVTSY